MGFIRCLDKTRKGGRRERDRKMGEKQQAQDSKGMGDSHCVFSLLLSHSIYLPLPPTLMSDLDRFFHLKDNDLSSCQS